VKEESAWEDKGRESGRRGRRSGNRGAVAIIAAALIGIAAAFIAEAGGGQVIVPFARGEYAVAANKLDDPGNGLFARKRPCVHPPIDTASIRGKARIALRSGARVGSVINPLWGVYRNLARRSDLWVLVYVVADRKFYPQSDRSDEPADLLPRGRSRGRFRTAAYFGAGPGASYEVIAVLARKAASRRLSARTGEGLTADELPSGLDQKDCVTVRG